MAARKLNEHGLKDAASHRVVLTGGCSQLPGIRDVAALVLDKQVRLGTPRNIPNIPKILYNPTFSASLGMLLFALNYAERKPVSIISRPAGDMGGIGKIFSWFKQNF